MTNTESIPEQVSLFVKTVYHVGFKGWAIGLLIVSNDKSIEGLQEYWVFSGDVGLPPRTKVSPLQIVNVSPPAFVGTFGWTSRNKVSLLEQLLFILSLFHG